MATYGNQILDDICKKLDEDCAMAIVRAIKLTQVADLPRSMTAPAITASVVEVAVRLLAITTDANPRELGEMIAQAYAMAKQSLSEYKSERRAAEYSDLS